LIERIGTNEHAPAMLQRSPRRRSKPTPDQRRRERRRQEQINYRERRDNGISMVRVPVDAEVMDWLVRCGYCDERDLSDLKTLGRKIGAVLSASARN
jgi:hypothetical protein